MKKIYILCRKIWVIMTTSQRILSGVVLIASLISAVLEMLGVSVIIPLVNALLQPDKLWENKYIAYLSLFCGLNDTEQLVSLVIYGTIVLYVFKNLFFIFNTWLRLKYSFKIMRECSVRMMTSYMERGYSFFVNNNVNELIQGATGDVSAVYVTVSYIFQAITQFAIVIFIGIFMCISDFQLAISVLLSALICLLLVIFIFRKRMLIAGEGIRKYAVLSNQTIMEAFHGVKEVLVMRKQSFFINEYEKNVIKRHKHQIDQGMGGEIPAYIIEGICITGIMIMLGIKTSSINDMSGYIAVLASFAVGAFRILPALGKISADINGASSYTANINSVYNNVIEARRMNFESDGINVKDKVVLDAFNEMLVVNEVTFAYDKDKLGYVLNGVSLKIEKGSSVALIGESGAGKSTLADIILGVLKADNGNVLIDGVKIDDIPNRWAEIIGFVPQSIYLSDSTIRENVAFGIPKTEIDDEAVCKALRKANILNYVNLLPNGINTSVGERGIKLSGGQRQRIGIARALYHNPEILILDEATSALDNDTEGSVMEAIESLQGNMTLIIIAHRLSTIRNCDKIYEIKDGKVLERAKSEIFQS